MSHSRSSVRMIDAGPARLKLGVLLFASMATGAGLSMAWQHHRQAADALRGQVKVASESHGVAPWAMPCRMADATDSNMSKPSAAMDAADASPQAVLERWLHGAASNDEDDAREAPFDRLVRQARQEPAFRQTLLRRFATEHDEAARRQLAGLLGASGGDEVARMSAELLHSGDPGQRRRGIELLSSLQGGDQVALRQTVADMLGSEKDPATLSMAVAALQPGELRDPQQVSSILSRLNQLSHHEAPAVRAAVIEASARWGQAAAEPGVLQGLGDADPAVVEAGIDAAGQAGLQTPATVDALLALAERGEVALALRQRALDTLAEMNLDTSRFNRFVQLHRLLIASGG